MTQCNHFGRLAFAAGEDEDEVVVVETVEVAEAATEAKVPEVKPAVKQIMIRKQYVMFFILIRLKPKIIIWCRSASFNFYFEHMKINLVTLLHM